MNGGKVGTRRTLLQGKFEGKRTRRKLIVCLKNIQLFPPKKRDLLLGTRTLVLNSASLVGNTSRWFLIVIAMHSCPKINLIVCEGEEMSYWGRCAVRGGEVAFEGYSCALVSKAISTLVPLIYAITICFTYMSIVVGLPFCYSTLLVGNCSMIFFDI